MNRWKNVFDFRVRRFIPRRQSQMRAELLQFFVQREPGRFGRDLEENSARFAEINGMKIGAIDNWSDVVTKVDETGAPFELLGVVLRSKSDVMNRSGGNTTHARVGQTKEIDNSSRSGLIGGRETKTVSRIIDQAKAKRVGQQA